MSSERDDNTPRAADEDKIQTAGRDANAAQPLNAADDNAGPERYPSVRQDDAVERTGRADAVTGETRSFDPNPTPRQGAGDGSGPNAKQDGQLGAGGDPAEGKR
jgi:hypothetical protein